MTTVSQLAASDSLVRSDGATRNYSGLTYLGMNSSPQSRYSFLYFNRPFPLGATIVSATLNLHDFRAATGGARTLTVARVAASYQASKITWSNKPDVTGTSTTLTQGDSTVDGRLWAIDVTPQMQSVSDGAAWYGFRVTSSIATHFSVHSRDSSVFQPTLDIVWSDAPDAPSVLAPSNGRAVSVARPTLRFDFTDVSGDTSMQGFELQMNPSNVWTAPSVTTGVVASNAPEWLVNFDVLAAAVWWWRVRVKDGAGIWSAWSAGVSFTRTAKPAVTITNPAASPNNFVSEASPPFSWTATGQVAYQLFVTDPVDTATVLWTSGKVTSADTAVSLPIRKPAVISPGGSYNLTVRIWDNVARESTPGDPVYTDASRVFTFNLSATVAPVTVFTVTGAAPRPDAVLGWMRTTAPDSFTILRDGKVIDTGIEPVDLLVSGTTYAYTDLTASPRTPHTWSVVCVVNGISSASNPTDTETLLPEGIWLSKLDGTSAICITGVDGAFTIEASEDSSVHYPLGASNGVLITQAVHGRIGSVSGFLKGAQAGLETVTLATWVAAFEALRTPRGQTLSLTLTDTQMNVFIHNTLKEPGVEFHGDAPVSFDYSELL